MTASPRRNHRPERNGPAAITTDHQKRSKGTYSFAEGDVNQYYRARRAREDPANDRLARILLGRAKVSRQFDFRAWRLMEIMRVIRARYGRFLPENDGTEFFEAVAAAYQAGGSQDVLADLRGWCWCAAPWACDPRYAAALAEVASAASARRRDLRADAIANLLRVTMAERLALGLQTIGACDVSPAQRQKIMKVRKMENDRARQRAKRTADGRQDRGDWLASNSTSREEPWKAAGVSRATWYRRQKDGRETGLSKQEYIQLRDTPVSAVETVRDSEPAAIAAPCLERDIDPQRTKLQRGAQRSGACLPAGRLPGSECERGPHDVLSINAALDFFYVHNKKNGRWRPAPGSEVDVVAA